MNDPTAVDLETGEVLDLPTGHASLFDEAIKWLESPETDKIDKDLWAAQPDIEPIIREAENPQFRKKYATIKAYLDALRPALHKHNMYLSQPTIPLPNGKHRLFTRVRHVSGQWIGSVYEMTPTRADPQGEGSALTYARRYQVSSLLSVAAEEDDDGNAASAPAQQQRGARQQTRPAAGTRDWLGEAQAIKAKLVPPGDKRVELLQLMEACEKAKQMTPALNRTLITMGKELAKEIEATTAAAS